MPEWVKTLITVLIAVFGSSGFWAYIAKRNEKKDVKTQMLIGLAHAIFFYVLKLNALR